MTSATPLCGGVLYCMKTGLSRIMLPRPPRVSGTIIALSLLALSPPGAAPDDTWHPSCAVGQLLTRQGDDEEAVLALEMCWNNHAPSVSALRL
jgi:hypothetical protein